MKPLFEYLSTKAKKVDDQTDSNPQQSGYKEPPMSYSTAVNSQRAKFNDVVRKMDAWAAGTRKENIKACSDAKLILYYRYCQEKKYQEQCDMIESVANSRGYTMTKLKEF